MHIQTLSVFPEMFEGFVNCSIMARARKAGIWSFEAHDLRDWTHDRHRSVDDVPYGGGQGMLMKCEPVFEAVRDIVSRRSQKPQIIFFSPVGRPFNQRVAEELSMQEEILFVCGRYEGFDERVYSLADYCISLGDYVLTGGELPAMVVTDAVVRLLPGALGNEVSYQDESFSSQGLLEYAQYTRPASFEGMEVPEVLLSGHHKRVEEWRRQNALERTFELRPDLLEHAQLSEDDRRYLELLKKAKDEK